VKVQWARKVIADFCDRVRVDAPVGPIADEARRAGYDVIAYRTTRPPNKRLIVSEGWFGARCRCEIIHRADRVVRKRLIVGH